MKTKMTLKEIVYCTLIAGATGVMMAAPFIDRSKWNSMNEGSSETIHYQNPNNPIMDTKDYAIFRDSEGEIYKIIVYQHSFASPRGGQPSYFTEYAKEDKAFDRILGDIGKKDK